MKAFISYSSKDADFITKVVKELGRTQYELDQRSFEYTLNVEAIRRALARCDLYVLFLSQNSVTSTFVSEEQRAALEGRGKGIIDRVLIFSIDGTSYKTLPEWLREINIVANATSPKACARRIQSTLISTAAEKNKKDGIFIGRDQALAEIRQALAAPPGKTPLAIHVVGHYGIGRRAFLRRTRPGSVSPNLRSNICHRRPVRRARGTFSTAI